MNSHRLTIVVLGTMLICAIGVIWMTYSISSDRARTIDQLRSANARLSSEIGDLNRDAKNKMPPAATATGSGTRGGTFDITKREDAQIIAKHEASKAKNAARILEQTIAAPEVQSAYFRQMKSGLPVAYGSLYHRLSLTKEQISQFESILADRFQTVSDVELAGRANGLTRKDPLYEKIYSEAIATTENRLVQLLGDDGYRKYVQHEQRVPVQTLVESLSGKAAGMASPLSPGQMAVLSEVLLAHSNSEMGASGDWVRNSVIGRGSSNVTLTDIDWKTAISQLSPLLPAKQFEILEQIAAEASAKKLANELSKKTKAQVSGTSGK